MKQQIVKYFLPPGFRDALRSGYAYAINRKYFPVLAQNRRFQNRHSGERCFIACNGPSVKAQNLKALKGEVVISVSSGYHHPDYQEYSPRYHCTPQFTMSSAFTEDIAVRWLREMHTRVGNAEIFHSIQEAPLIQRHNLYPGRQVNFLCMAGSFTGNPHQKIDLTRIVPSVTTVPIMALMIALYMGFKEIYLLGTDHDSYRSREYNYFYDPSRQFGGGVTGFTGPVDTPVAEELLIYYQVFMQYRALRSIAQARGVAIYNATLGGALEELPRINLEAVFSLQSAPKIG
jgi:hypothetical protein